MLLFGCWENVGKRKKNYKLLILKPSWLYLILQLGIFEASFPFYKNQNKTTWKKREREREREKERKTINSKFPFLLPHFLSKQTEQNCSPKYLRKICDPMKWSNTNFSNHIPTIPTHITNLLQPQGPHQNARQPTSEKINHTPISEALTSSKTKTKKEHTRTYSLNLKRNQSETLTQ